VTTEADSLAAAVEAPYDYIGVEASAGGAPRACSRWRRASKDDRPRQQLDAWTAPGMGACPATSQCTATVRSGDIGRTSTASSQGNKTVNGRGYGSAKGIGRAAGNCVMG
jgi:hypothetical protein